VSLIAARALRWYDRHGRHDLPWQHPRSAYRVWVSEIMLQQTQVATVIPYFLRFVTELPDMATLAAAPRDRVLALWSGLGYYQRARHLHEAAAICMRDHDGELPRALSSLTALPGVGRSTAGAILALAHGQRQPILDGNVRRLLCRHRGVRGWPGNAAVLAELWKIAEASLPDARIDDYTQALMDLGATVCTPTAPRCEQCPLRDDCIAQREGIVAQLPQRRPSKALPTRQTCVLIACDDKRRILLQRRPRVGVWAGLWSLPEAVDTDSAQAWLSRHAQVGESRHLASFTHTFSHYRLQIQPLLWSNVRRRDRIGDNDDLRWQALAEMRELGLPAPIRKLLEGLS